MTEQARAHSSPLLHRAGLGARMRDLIWFVVRIAAAHRLSAIMWAAIAVAGGLLLPLQLWATQHVANTLQQRIEGDGGDGLWLYVAVWLASLAATLIAEQIEPYFAAAAQERGGARIAIESLQKSTRIELAAFENQAFYDRMAMVLSDAEAKAREVLSHAVQLGWVVPRVTAWASVLLLFDWRLFAIAALPLIPAMWAWYFSGAIYWDIYREQTRDRRLAAYYAGLVTDRQSVREVRMLGLAPLLIERWELQYWRSARELRNRALRVSLRQRGTSFAATVALVLGFAWFIGIFDRDIAAGTAVIVVSSFMSLYSGIYNTADPIQKLGQAAGFASDVRSFLALPEEAARNASLGDVEVKGDIRLEGVSFRYPGNQEPVLSGIDLTIRPGETVALVGENGAGKTTLVKLMLGLYRPTSGSVLLDGLDVANLDPDSVREHVSGVFQHFVRYPLTVAENVAAGGGAEPGALRRELELAGIAESLDRLPQGMDTVLSPDLGGVDLSGGQWQRLAIARAGLRQAQILCLDEPTAALDPQAEVAIFERFADLAGNRTTILVSHRLGMTRLASRIVVLEHGRIIEQGTHDDLLAIPGSAYGRMWQAQARWYQ